MANSSACDQHLFSCRIRSVQHWVARRLGETRHERRVLLIAVRLFDLLGGFHGLGPSHRRLLKLGCFLHDVGRLHGARRHHIAGAQMILQSRSLPLHRSERTAAAYLTRYHRKQVPDPPKQESALQQAEHGGLRILLAILRAADALDSRRICPRALTMRLVGRNVGIHVYIQGERRRACRAFEKRRRFQLLKKTLGVSVKLRVLQTSIPSRLCGSI